MSANPTPLNDWSAGQYLKFEDERTRPARDLLAQVPLKRVRTAVDLGCGPGNSTELLLERYPDAAVIGVDSSKDMLRQARERLPAGVFIEADLTAWIPQIPPDLLFANAVFQWIPNHPPALRRVVGILAEGGVLAAQMPDNTREPSLTIMRDLSTQGSWADNPALAGAARPDLPPAEFYYDLLAPVCSRVEIWQTIYHHVLDGPKAIVEWFRGTALRPFLSALDAPAAADFLEAYTAEVARHYPARSDGKTLLRFPRLFVVATK